MRKMDVACKYASRRAKESNPGAAKACNADEFAFELGRIPPGQGDRRLALIGRRGGSAIAAASVNALASEGE